MVIKRERYIIVRKNRTEIFCGSSRNHSFEEINNLQNMKISVQSYATEKIAKSSFEQSWRNIDFEYEILKIKEKLEVVE